MAMTICAMTVRDIALGGVPVKSVDVTKCHSVAMFGVPTKYTLDIVLWNDDRDTRKKLASMLRNGILPDLVIFGENGPIETFENCAFRPSDIANTNGVITASPTRRR